MADGKPEAYFRGRKLKGKEIKVPEGYQGVIVTDAGKQKNAANKVGMLNSVGDRARAMYEDNEDEEEEDDINVLEEVSSFSDIMIWGHETIAESDDAFVKGMGEWISFAEAVCIPIQVA